MRSDRHRLVHAGTRLVNEPMPYASIVVPALNEARFIAQCLTSLLAQAPDDAFRSESARSRRNQASERADALRIDCGARAERGEIHRPMPDVLACPGA